eukprot:UN28018
MTFFRAKICENFLGAPPPPPALREHVSLIGTKIIYKKGILSPENTLKYS